MNGAIILRRDNWDAYIRKPLSVDERRLCRPSATARNRDWDVTIPPKGAAQGTLQQPGLVDYFCRFHPT